MATIMQIICRLSVIASFGSMFIGSAEADVTFDGTVGHPGALTGPDYVIEQSRGQRVGNNLFHSFGKFSVNAGEGATFTGDAGISNIVSRVTGGEESVINGRLAVAIPAANLYLVNPAGIVFGEHASLDVAGALHVSTADYVELKGGGRYDATQPTQTVLTTGAPERYGFISGDTGHIRVEGARLRQTGNNALVMVTGGIDVNAGEVTTESGALSLVTAGGPGTVGLDSNQLPTSIAGKGGSIVVANASTVGSSELLRRSWRDVRAGAIFMNSGSVVVEHSLVGSSNFSTEDAGNITVETRDLSLLNGGRIFSRMGGYSKTADINIHASGDILIQGISRGNGPYGMGTWKSGIYQDSNDQYPGAIQIQAGNLRIHDGVILADHGNITLNIRNAMSLSATDFWYYPDEQNTYDWETGFAFGVAATNARTGSAGNISITTNLLQINNAAINTFESYRYTVPGTITIHATDAIEMSRATISADMYYTPTCGTITISTPDLSMANSSYITANARRAFVRYPVALPIGEEGGGGGFGYVDSGINGGGIAIDAHRLVINEEWVIPKSFSEYVATYGLDYISNDDAQDSYESYLDWLNTETASGIYAYSYTKGDGGSIKISSEEMTLSGRAKIETSSLGEDGGGNAGDINIAATTLMITGADVRNDDTASISASTHTSGEGGAITVRASDIDINERARIEASTTSSGDGGAVDITAQQVAMTGGGRITTGTTGVGRAGDISLSTSELRIDGTSRSATQAPSGLFAETTGSGDGGEVHVISKDAAITGGGRISTSTSTAGHAGRIHLATDSLIVSGRGSAIVSDSAGVGDAGEVNITGNRLRIEKQGTVSTTSSKGHGGAINVDMNRGIVLAGNGTSISAETHGDGDGGNINIKASPLELTDGASITTSTTASGGGGMLEINGTDLTLRGGSAIRSNSSGNGDAGSIIIRTSKSVQLSDSAIETESSQSGGGNITIRTRDILDMNNSRISANVNGGTGTGGNIDIDPEVVRLRNSAITANAVHGDGGSIRIVAGVLVKDSSSEIEASSEYGLDGDVVIDAPIIVTSQGREDPHLLKNTSVKSRCRAVRTGDGTLVVLPRMGNASHTAVFFGGMADLGFGRAVPVSSSGACSS